MYTDVVQAQAAKRLDLDPSLEAVCLFSVIGLALSAGIILLLSAESVELMLALAMM